MANKKDDDYAPHIAEALNNIEELKLMGQHKESITEAEKLLFEDPNCVEALEEIADNYVSLDDYAKAEKACHRALKLDKDSYTAQYILGFIHSQKQEWPKAITYLKNSNTLHSNNPEILRCLGWAMFNANKRTQGTVILERALNLDPDNALTLCDLGICYMQMKNFDKSVQLLKKAMELDPKNKRIRECYTAASNFRDRFMGMHTKR
ncbi:MAG: tetratricopeptide repeat protein [Candidatus Peregrinibacteria bacterium]|nr:tetratricopeptide repeat protein [Candidatus Peregrinibacteria bacterium]